jgi:hypothetical protein
MIAKLAVVTAFTAAFAWVLRVITREVGTCDRGPTQRPLDE